MIDDNRLAGEYPELQAGLRDPLTHRVLDDLDRAYTLTPPASLRNDLNAAVQERAAAFERAWPAGPPNSVRGRATRRRLIGRRQSLAVCVVAFALLAGAAGGSYFRFTLPAPARIEAPIPTASPNPTSIGTPTPMPTPIPPLGNGRVLVGTSPEMKQSVVNIPSDVSRVFCKANVPRMAKGTALTIRFQQFPYKADYYTHPFLVGAMPLYAYLYGPLLPGQWRCTVDMPGGILGSAYFKVR